MGWVRTKAIHEPRVVPQLWDEMRDSIGNAVAEFNALESNASDASSEHLDAKDCTAMGIYCRRVTKAFGAISIEVFLQEEDRTLRTSRSVVCRYRIRSDGSKAEFFLDKPEGSVAISTEEACRLALEEFIFQRPEGDKA